MLLNTLFASYSAQFTPSTHGAGDARVLPPVFDVPMAARTPMRVEGMRPPAPMTQEQLLQAPPGRVNYNPMSVTHQGFNAESIEHILEALLTADRAARESTAAREARQMVNDTISQNPTWNLPSYITNPQHAGNMRGSSRLADWTPPYAWDPEHPNIAPPAFFHTSALDSRDSE